MDDEQPFSMPIEDFFVLKGRGIMVTGRAKTGTLRKGDKIYLVGVEKRVEARVAGFEGFIHSDPDLWVAHAGDNTFILLKDVNHDDIERGMIVTTDPGE